MRCRAWKRTYPNPQNRPPPIASFVQNLALNPGGIYGMGTTQVGCFGMFGMGTTQVGWEESLLVGVSVREGRRAESECLSSQ